MGVDTQATPATQEILGQQVTLAQREILARLATPVPQRGQIQVLVVLAVQVEWVAELLS